MKNFKLLFVLLITIFVTSFFFLSCTSAKETITNKSGAQLWGENCIRCHNTPSPADFNDEQWKTIGLHMQDRANLTQEETTKIVEFLKSSN